MTADPAAPPPGTRLCALADLADPGAKGFSFRAGERLFTGFVVRRGGEVFAYVDRCPHAGMPLAVFGDRFLLMGGESIVCAAHGATFAIRSGACLGGPCEGRGLTPWPVTLEDGAVLAG